MRILLVSNWFPPVISGSSYYTSSLAQALALRGHDVAVVTVDWGNEYNPAQMPFPVYLLPSIRLPRMKVFYSLQLMGITCTPGNQKRMKAIIHEFKPDILHHVNHIFDTAFLSTRAAHKNNLPIVGSITTIVQHEKPMMQALMSLGDRLVLGPLGVNRWDGIVSLDKSAHEYVGKLYGRKVQERSCIIPFGVRMEAETLYRGRQPLAERPTILFTGHIHPFRNPTRLIEAMPTVLQEIPRAHLVLAGRVDLTGPVETARRLGLTEEQVTFLGETAHEKVVDLMKTAHVFANWVTGPFTGLGTAPMEAMLCGLPVVNDLPEDLFGEAKLVDGENIVLVDSHEPTSIAAGILRLLQNEDLRRRVGEAGRRFVKQHLNWEGIAEKMELFYQAIMEKRSTPSRENGK